MVQNVLSKDICNCDVQYELPENYSNNLKLVVYDL